MSWLIDSDGLDHRTRRMTVHYGAEPATFSDVLGAWARDDAFVQRWCSALGGVPFAAYNWELPALVPDRLELPFECVCVDNPALARVRAEPDAFAEHFGGQSVATFRNLGGDSVLIAPAPEGDFPHLAAFCRTARSITGQVPTSKNTSRACSATLPVSSPSSRK